MITVNDIIELKRRIRPEECSITRFAGAYVDGAKEIITSFNKTFLSLEESEYLKYLELIKSAYSKKIQDNILTLEFNPANNSERRDFLLDIVKSGLKNTEDVMLLFEYIKENLDYPGNFLILLFHDNYDVMKRTTDGLELDESEEVYSFIQCLICPVSLEKGSLQYNCNENKIAIKERDWVVEKPLTGFIYPAFENRSAEVNHVIYYGKKPKEPAKELMTEVLQCKEELTVSEARDLYTHCIKMALIENEESWDEYLEIINMQFEYMLEDHDEDMEISNYDLIDILRTTSIPERFIQKIGEEYARTFSHRWPMLSWLHDPKLTSSYMAKQRNKKGRKLLEESKNILITYGSSEKANEIEQFLESTRQVETPGKAKRK